MNESVDLGGNITLSGFSSRDFTDLIVVKKIVGQCARKLTDSVPGFTKLEVHLKEVHPHSDGKGGKSELVAKVHVEGKEYAAEVVDHNLFVALDSVLKRVYEQAHKEMEKHGK